jgi:hypothetical protein
LDRSLPSSPVISPRHVADRERVSVRVPESVAADAPVEAWAVADVPAEVSAAVEVQEMASVVADDPAEVSAAAEAQEVVWAVADDPVEASAAAEAQAAGTGSEDRVGSAVAARGSVPRLSRCTTRDRAS